MSNTLPPQPIQSQSNNDYGKTTTVWASYQLAIQNAIDNFAPNNAQYVVTQSNSQLSNEFVLGNLSTGFLKVTSVSGNLTSQATINSTDLTTTGVATGDYSVNGSTLFTVNDVGQLTAAYNTIVSAAPNGTASGDLDGSYPSPTISASWIGSTGITTLGTIITGTWTGTTIAVANGGTGSTSKTAYAVICGGTTSTTAFQSIASVGTSGQALVSNGAGALPTFQDIATTKISKIVVQTFTATGTYTPTANMVYCWVRLQGSGGGGGGALGAVTGVAAGGGGGSGGYSEGLITAATIGASKAVTIDTGGAAGAAGNNNGTAGGVSSLSTLITAAGGLGGIGGSNSTVVTRGSLGGAGGTAGGSSSNLAVIGQSGTPSIQFGTTAWSGSGGSSQFGSGGQGYYETTVGLPGNSYGAGGAGGCSTTVSKAGGAGVGGFLEIIEFCTS